MVKETADEFEEKFRSAEFFYEHNIFKGKN